MEVGVEGGEFKLFCVLGIRMWLFGYRFAEDEEAGGCTHTGEV